MHMKNLATLVIGMVVFTAPLSAFADTFTRPLAVGARGEDVAALQKVLIDAGFLKVASTGYFGLLTKSAVMAYQKANALEQIGSIGPKTRMLLNAYVAAKVSAQTSTQTVVNPPISGAGTASTAQPAASQQSTTSTQASASTSVPASTPTASPNDPLKITLVSPVTAVARTSYGTTFSVSTDKPATCRYGTQPGMSLSNMTSFTDSGGTVHSKLLTGLSPDAYYVYYVRCEDSAAHLSPDLMVSFWTNGQ